MAQFAGVWKLESSENFDEYMKEIGIGWMMRKAGNSSKPVVTITVTGSHFSFKQESALSTSSLEFDLDKEIDEKTVDGRACKSIFTLTADGKLIQTQKGSVNSTFTRYIENGVLVVEAEANGVKCVRKYTPHK